jgi:hypothetical protein
MTKEIEEKFVSDDGYSTAADAVDGAGGKIKAKKATLLQQMHIAAYCLQHGVIRTVHSSCAQETKR